MSSFKMLLLAVVSIMSLAHGAAKTNNLRKLTGSTPSPYCDQYAKTGAGGSVIDLNLISALDRETAINTCCSGDHYQCCNSGGQTQDNHCTFHDSTYNAGGGGLLGNLGVDLSNIGGCGIASNNQITVVSTSCGSGLLRKLTITPQCDQWAKTGDGVKFIDLNLLSIADRQTAANTCCSGSDYQCCTSGGQTQGNQCTFDDQTTNLGLGGLLGNIGLNANNIAGCGILANNQIMLISTSCGSGVL